MIASWIQKIYLKRLKALCNKPTNKITAIHSMVCHADVLRYLVAIYSLLRNCQTIPKIIVHDDGTLTKHDYQMISIIPNVSLITPQQADRRAKRVFRHHRRLLKYRQLSAFNKKLIHSLLFKNTFQQTLLLDSDVVFFRYPEEIIDFFVQRKKTNPIYLQDIKNAYITNRKALRTLFHINVLPRVNSGLLGFQTKILTLKFVSGFYSTLDRTIWNSPPHDPWIEQTAFAILISRYTPQKLSTRYYLGSNKTPNYAICRHYVQGTRKYYLFDVLSWELKRLLGYEN